MPKQPLVSIIVPTKNSEEFIEKCLISISKQSYKDFELIVVDNNSTDKTVIIAKKYTSNVVNKGPERSAQRNYGAKLAKGQYLLFVDSDMELDTCVVEDCVKASEKDQETVGIIIPEESFGEGFWAQCKKLERSFYVGINWIEAARFYKKLVFEKLGGYDETMISGEDWDLSNKMKRLGKISRIDSFIFHNEGKILLSTTIRKKLHYAKQIITYKKASKTDSDQQFSIVQRYKLFFSKPGKLFKNPLIGIGMLFMKTLELGIGGVAYILTSFNKNEKYLR
jgi:glycosyltransferase involved in cell wall biosynthesis